MYTTQTSTPGFATYEQAVEEAKRKAERNGYEQVFILKAVAKVKTPVPNYEVETIA